MHLYLESADPDEIREALAWRVVDGVVTTPELLARRSADAAEVLSELCRLHNGPVLAGVTSADTADMVEEGRALAQLHERIVVRVPCTPAGIPAIAALADDRIPVDAMLCFSLPQALLAAKAGARFISPPVGEMDAAGGDGLSLMGAVITMLDQYDLKTSVLADGLVHPGHVAEASRMGADAGAVSLLMLRGLAEHPLTESLRRKQLERWRRAQN